MRLVILPTGDWCTLERGDEVSLYELTKEQWIEFRDSGGSVDRYEEWAVIGIYEREAGYTSGVGYSWPVCARCGEIASVHDTDGLTPRCAGYSLKQEENS